MFVIHTLVKTCIWFIPSQPYSVAVRDVIFVLSNLVHNLAKKKDRISELLYCAIHAHFFVQRLEYFMFQNA